MKRVYPLFILCSLFFSSLNAQILWDNFEDTRKGTYGFINGVFTPYTQNPAPGGDNNSLIVAEYIRNAAEMFDVLLINAEMADLSDYLSGTKKMSIDVWSPSAGITVQITLENKAAAAAAFPAGRHSIYTKQTTVAMGWETLTLDFVEQPDNTVDNNNVDQLVLLFNPGTNTGDTYYWDNLNGPELDSDPCDGVSTDAAIFNDFECNQNVNFTFSHSGPNFRRVANPDMMGNSSDFVASYTRNAGENIDVITGRFDGAISLSADSRIELDVWDPASPTTVRLALQNDMDQNIIEMDLMTSTSSAWETLVFDPSSVAAATDITRFVLLFDPESNTSDNYFFDNFKSTSTTTSVNNLTEISSFEAFPNPSQGQTTFQYELTSAAEVNLTIQDITGKVIAQVVNERQQAGAQQATWNADQIPNGMYLYTMTINGETATGKIVLTR